ncbi:MAG: hypothetical protein DI570_20360 [Phenylobacterium zucineum]|nr:MAG: hypothetical protein DI570_20360 [Phenylobacterium zucineum]
MIPTSPLARQAAAAPVELAGSLPELVTRLLEHTPEVRDPVRQRALTDRLLVPAVPALEALMREVRAGLDPALRAAADGIGGKAYPLGRCREITQAVQQRLAGLDPGELSAPARQGWAALRAFRAAGGQSRSAWGDLRGQYFQNALIVGALYVDVSNDTVVVSKPPIEILPFEQAGFSPIRDYAHFIGIAGRYWGHRFLRNHLFPDLAPYRPLIQVGPDGRIRLGPDNGHMLGVTLAAGLDPSAVALAGAPMPADAFAALAARVGPMAGMAATPEAGRAAALANCAAWGAAVGEAAERPFNRAMMAIGEINRRLAR